VALNCQLQLPAMNQTRRNAGALAPNVNDGSRDALVWLLQGAPPLHPVGGTIALFPQTPASLAGGSANKDCLICTYSLKCK